MDPITLPDSLVTQLRAYEARLRRIETLVAVACGLVGLLATFVLLFMADRFVDTPRWARLVLTITGGIIPAWIARGWARHWLWQRRGPAQLAKLLQRHFQTLGDRLQGIIELTESNDLPENISPALLRAAVRQVAEESGRFQFREAVPVRPARRWALAAVVLLALTATPFVFAPKAATNALSRWVRPWAKIDRYTFASFEALPKQLVVPHGEPFEIACGVKADSEWKPETVTARIERQDPKEQRLENGRAVFSFEGQTQDGTLTLRMGDAAREIVIRPMHRPEMKQLAASVDLPDYLGYPSTTVPIEGSSAEFLEGSSVSFTGKVTRRLGSASMQTAAPQSAEVRADTFVTPETSVADLGKETTFRWADTYGLTPTQPYAIRVNMVKDAEPRVELQGLDMETAILPDEVLKLDLAATDDYGLKEAWLGWSTRTLGEKQADLGKGESKHTAGDHAKRELSTKAEFSPTWQKIPEDSVVELAGYAVDYYPDRKPVESWKYTVYVLSPAKHAERVRQRMDEVYKQLEERIRDEERQIEETKTISENKKDLAAEKTAEDIKRVEAGERQNESQMQKLTEQMQDIMKDAMRNKEIPEGIVADWQQLMEKLQQQADPPMQAAAESLSQAGQQANSREGELSKAQEQEQKALDAMRNASKKMDKTTQNLYARNFYNRLRASASAEHSVADGLKTLAKDSAGLKPEEISDGKKKDFEGVARKQDDTTKEVDKIVNDMADFVRRVPDEKYEAVEKDMQDKKVTAELTELSGFVRANLGFKSLGRATFWGDKLDEWATMLQSECHAQGGGEMDPELLELLVAMVRAAQTQDNIREETGLLESKKDSPDHARDARKLSGQQDQLYWAIDELREKTKFNDVKPVLKEAEGLMQEVTDDLRKPQTDDPVVALQGDVIEVLVPPDKKNGKASGAAGQMLRKMMAQSTRARKAGGNNGKSSSSFAGESADGAVSRAGSNGRNVDKTGGGTDAGEWPEEFRDELQAFFQATDSGTKDSGAK